MATLREFLSELATDATRLGEFILDPDASMSGAELSEADKAALRSGFANVIAARLAGLPAQEAFAATLQAPAAAGLFPSLQISPLQISPLQITPPLQLPLQISPPQIVPPLQLPLQFPPLQLPPPQLPPPPQIVPPLMLQQLFPPPPLMLQQLFPPPPPPQISPLQFPPLQLPPLQFPPPQLLASGQTQGYPSAVGYGSPYYGYPYYGRGW